MKAKKEVSTVGIVLSKTYPRNNLVLRHPDNDLDVLRDWTMKEVEIYWLLVPGRRII